MLKWVNIFVKELRNYVELDHKRRKLNLKNNYVNQQRFKEANSNCKFMFDNMRFTIIRELFFFGNIVMQD